MPERKPFQPFQFQAGGVPQQQQGTAPRPVTQPSPQVPDQPIATGGGTPSQNIMGMINQFRADFPVGESNLMDPATNRAATDRFGQILGAAGGDFHAMRDEIGPVRMGDRMREMLMKPDTLNQSGVIGIGNGLTLDTRSGALGEAAQQAAVANVPSATAAAAPQFTQDFSAPSGSFFNQAQLSSFAANPQSFAFSPQQQAQLAQFDPQRVAAFETMVRNDLNKAFQEQQRGALIEGDQTRNPVAFAQFVNQRVKQGMPLQQAINEVNAQMTPDFVDRQGRRGFDVMQQRLDMISNPNYLNQVIASGFLGDPRQAVPPVPPQTPVEVPRGDNPLGDGNIPPAAPQGEPAPFPNQGPVNAVGQDPLTGAINASLGEIMGAGGGATSGIGRVAEDALARLLTQGGGLDNDILSARLESAGEELIGAEQQAIQALEARLADRNLRGGAFAGGLQDLTEDVFAQRARTTRDIFADEAARADQRLLSGLGLGSSLAQSGTQNLLGAIGAGTQQQDMLGRLALANLAEQNDFAQFVAQFGLDRDQVLADIERGRLTDLVPFLQLFFQGAGQSAQGFIPN